MVPCTVFIVLASLRFEAGSGRCIHCGLIDNSRPTGITVASSLPERPSAIPALAGIGPPWLALHHIGERRLTRNAREKGETHPCCCCCPASATGTHESSEDDLPSRRGKQGDVGKAPTDTPALAVQHASLKLMVADLSQMA